MPRKKPFRFEDEKELASPALQLVELVWREAPHRSWMRLNHTMQDALSTAIKSGLRFDPGDIEAMWTKMRGGYWFTGANNEWIHRLACIHGNTTAAVSYEKWVGRGPFFLENRLYVSRSVDFKYLPMSDLVDRHPLCAVVSSFAEDGQSVNICVYADFAPDHKRSEGIVMPSGKPIRRIRVTLTRIRDLEKARKAGTTAPNQGRAHGPFRPRVSCAHGSPPCATCIEAEAREAQRPTQDP